MKALVAVKRVVDYNVKVRVKADQTGVETAAELQPLAVAKLLKAVIEREGPEIVIIGKQAIDDDCNQTGQMLAAVLGWPQATFASKILIQDQVALVTREVDSGLEVLEVALP